MKNEIFMSMLPMWHTQEILSPALNSSGDFNFSSSLVDKAAAADNRYPLKFFNSSAVSSSPHIFHPPVKSNNSLLKELIGKMALNSSTGNFSPISQVSNFRSRSSNGRFCPNRREGSKNRVTQYQGGLSSSHEDQIRGGETGVDLKKRKSSGRLMVAEVEDDSNSKRTKQIEDDNNIAGVCKDDYIHVRARMGQATDNHSLSERVRREKIGERMKILQNLVPGCNKVTGKAVMLDEIINYVQSLQRQVQFLSMKLVSMNANGISNSNLKVETAVDSSPFMNSSTGSTLNPPLDPTPYHPLASNRFMKHHILPTNEDLKVQYHELFGDELHYIVTTGYGA